MLRLEQAQNTSKIPLPKHCLHSRTAFLSKICGSLMKTIHYNREDAGFV